MAQTLSLSASGKLVMPDGTPADVTLDDVTIDEITLTKLGVGASVPVTSQSAYTQTYSTANKTVAAPTQAALTDNTTGTTTTTLAAGVGVYDLVLPSPANLSTLSTGGVDVITGLVPGHKFKILSYEFITTVAGTGAGATLVFNFEIGTTNLTGGVLTLDLADTDTIGKREAATAITAANTGTASDAISLEVAAGGTAFTAGAGFFVVKIQNMDTADAFAGLVTQHAAGVADDLDNRQSITAVIDDLQVFGLAL